MTTSLLESVTERYTWLIENPTQSRNIQFNFQYWELAKLSPERLIEEIEKCSKKFHTDCLPHLCVKAHFLLANEIKSEIRQKCFYSDKKLLIFTTSEPKPNHLNLYRNALLRMGHSEEFAKQFYTCNPPTDFYLLKDLSMLCILQHIGEGDCQFGWVATDNTLSMAESRALAKKHDDVIQREKLGLSFYSI
jgi:hypothetical protein